MDMVLSFISLVAFLSTNRYYSYWRYAPSQTSFTDKLKSFVRDNASMTFRALHLASFLFFVGFVWFWIEPTLLGKVISFAGLVAITILLFILFIIVSDWAGNYRYNRPLFDTKLGDLWKCFRREVGTWRKSLDYFASQIIWCAGLAWALFILLRMSSVAWGIFSGFVSYMRS